MLHIYLYDHLFKVLSARFIHCKGFLSFCNQKVMLGDTLAPYDSPVYSKPSLTVLK